MKQSIDGEMVKGHAEMLILALLHREGPLHGYLIRKKLTDLSHQVLQPSYGRLYPHLATMEKKGWLKSRTEVVCESRVRKAYSITATGRTELKRRIKKWQLFSAGIDLILDDCQL
ncbi:MAG: helix-turn-helix transcriptional regulator [Verrucomicrobia bacterium]|nr:helix-turn-helix transcriptional regulator [Verrucomicrobiota bacterium]